MNRHEALRTLGLDDDASAEEIQAAYKESVQILHPDRFAGKKKLQERATEQFKNLQEAYEFLTSGEGAARSSSSSRRAYNSYKAELEGRLAGVQAARTELVAQRDSFFDRRRTATTMLVVGLLVAVFLRRIPAIAGIGAAAAVWGIVDLFSTSGNINSLTEQLDALTKEKQQILAELEELD